MIKKVYFLVLIFLLFILIEPSSIHAEDNKFEGYIPISSVEDLKNIEKNMGANYYLTNDIDLGQVKNWMPLGYSDDYDYAMYFYGILDGNGYSINNLTSAIGGLFYRITSPCIIKNLSIEDATVYNSDAAGILANISIHNDSQDIKITNCYVSGILSSNSPGGFIGEIKKHGQFSSGKVIFNECYINCIIAVYLNYNYSFNGNRIFVSWGTEDVKCTNCGGSGILFHYDDSLRSEYNSNNKKKLKQYISKSYTVIGENKKWWILKEPLKLEKYGLSNSWKWDKKVNNGYPILIQFKNQIKRNAIKQRIRIDDMFKYNVKGHDVEQLVPKSLKNAFIAMQLDKPEFEFEYGKSSSFRNNIINFKAPNGCKIFYTTDGSIPTTKSKLYTKPIKLTKNVEIRAISSLKGYKTSEVAIIKLKKDKSGSFEAETRYNTTWSGKNSAEKGRIGRIVWIKGLGVQINGYALVYPGIDYDSQIEELAYDTDAAITRYGIPPAKPMSNKECLNWMYDNCYKLVNKADRDTDIGLVMAIAPIAFKAEDASWDDWSDDKEKNRAVRFFIDNVQSAYSRGVKR